MAANPGLIIANLHSLLDEWHQSMLEPEGMTYKSDRPAGIETIWVLPQGADTKQIIFYVHDGGFTAGSADSHRKFAGHLARYLSATAAVTDYRHAPGHPFPVQIKDSTAVYKELPTCGFRSADIITSGDSAGDNLAILTVLKPHQGGVVLSAIVIAFSPRLDMEHIGEALQVNAAADALVSGAMLEDMSGMSLDKEGLRADPLTNPLKADFRGFPRPYINTNTVETLLDNAQDLARITKAIGVDVALSVAGGMQHVFLFLVGRAPEADDELCRTVH